MKTHLYLLSMFFITLTCCNYNEINNYQKNNNIFDEDDFEYIYLENPIVCHSQDSIIFHYGLTNYSNQYCNEFSCGDNLFITIIIENKSFESKFFQYLSDVGYCYNSKNQIVEDMSGMIMPDSIPQNITIKPNEKFTFCYSYNTCDIETHKGKFYYKSPEYIGIKNGENIYYRPKMIINFEIK